MNNNGAQFTTILLSNVGAENMYMVLWYKYDARAIKLGNIF